jgi:hypothetical protein
VTNNSRITTSGDLSPGMAAYSLAVGGSYTTGLAVATTTVTNNGSIVTLGVGSPGMAADAHAYSGGVADATTTVTNARGATIRTLLGYSPGIYASSLAAGLLGDTSSATTAAADTTVNNAGTIKTYGSPRTVCRLALTSRSTAWTTIRSYSVCWVTALNRQSSSTLAPM